MNRLPVVVVSSLVLVALRGTGQEKAQQKDTKPEEVFTLENIFPPKKKPLFGPSVRRVAFSHDGSWSAWLWRPYRERRHGSDLWLFEMKSGKKSRTTSAAVMAAFQKEAREVMEDRKKKREARKQKEKQGEKTGSETSELENGVGDEDAADEKAPRYGGVASFTWSPTANELLFTSGGDIYRLEAGQATPQRLTCTKKSERGVAYLPNGLGYTYMVDDALMRVDFGSHLVQQLDPKLPPDERMISYELSPNGKRLAFVARKGKGRRGGDRKVKIAQYRKRFMEVREIPRHVSDDPFPPTETAVYLYDLTGAMREKSEPVEVFRHEVSGPRDVLRTPEWSPDSEKVTFSVFEQESGHVNVLIGRLPVKEEKKTKEGKKKRERKKDAAGKRSGASDKSVAEAKTSAKEKEKRPKKHPAKVVYRWLHDGGPMTPRLMQPKFLPDSRHIVFLSEQTGFRHLHRLDPVYESQFPLTQGHFEVYPIDITKDHRTMFVAATKEHPTRRDVYAVDLEKGSMRRLTREAGYYGAAAVSPKSDHVLGTFQRYGALRELVHVDVASGKQTVLTRSHPEKTTQLTAVAPEFFSFENRHGQRIWGSLFKPKGWRKSDKRPLLIYVYGGPLGTRKHVVAGSYSNDGYFFNQYMTRQHGYLSATIDPRGMSGYGAMFEKANFERVGKPQVEDLSDGVKYLVETYGADSGRVGIHGWSFGGFQTQMCLYTASDVFQVGIAGAGPTEWENYNSWYSTGTIGRSRVGKPDLEKYSLLKLAKNLEGKLMLVHGMEDSNVLYQDTVRVYRELLKAGKETLVELFLDPTGGHGLGGDVKRLNRARKYEDFLVRNLGPADQRRDDIASKAGNGADKKVTAKAKSPGR